MKTITAMGFDELKNIMAYGRDADGNERGDEVMDACRQYSKLGKIAYQRRRVRNSRLHSTHLGMVTIPLS